MGILFADDATGVLAREIGATDVAIKGTPGLLDKFPDITSKGDYFYLSIVDPEDSSRTTREVMRVISLDKSNGVMEVERDVPGYPLMAHEQGFLFEIRLPTVALEDLKQEILAANASSSKSYRLVTDQVPIIGKYFKLSQTPVEGGFVRDTLLILDGNIVTHELLGGYEIDNTTVGLAAGSIFDGRTALVSYMAEGASD